MATPSRMFPALSAALLLGLCLGSGATWLLLSGTEKPGAEAGALRRELEGVRRENASLVADRDRLPRPVVKAPPAPPPVATPAPPAPPAPAPSIESRAWALSAPWREDALQIRDEAKRNAAIAAVRQALASTDPVEVLAGLHALRGISQVLRDKGAFRLLVVAQFESPDPLLRKAALLAVSSTSTAQGAEPGDVALLLRLKDDPSPEVRKDLASAISWAAKGDLTGEAGEVVLRAIEEIEAGKGAAGGKSGGAAVIHALGGSTYFRKPSPEIEEKLLALARDPDTRENALHFFFQNMEKTPKVVDVLAGIAEEGGSGSDNAIHCLAYTVPADQAPRVAALLAKVLENGARQNHQTCLFGLRNFGTEAELPVLDRLAANELLDAYSRKSIAETAEFIRRRVRR